jgi:hypothetical protein
MTALPSLMCSIQYVLLLLLLLVIVVVRIAISQIKAF